MKIYGFRNCCCHTALLSIDATRRRNREQVRESASRFKKKLVIVVAILEIITYTS